MPHLSRPVSYRRDDIIRFAVDPEELQRRRLAEVLRKPVWTTEDDAIVRAAINALYAPSTDD